MHSAFFPSSSIIHNIRIVDELVILYKAAVSASFHTRNYSRRMESMMYDHCQVSISHNLQNELHDFHVGFVPGDLTIITEHLSNCESQLQTFDGLEYIKFDKLELFIEPRPLKVYIRGCDSTDYIILVLDTLERLAASVIPHTHSHTVQRPNIERESRNSSSILR